MVWHCERLASPKDSLFSTLLCMKHSVSLSPHAFPLLSLPPYFSAQPTVLLYLRHSAISVKCMQASLLLLVLFEGGVCHRRKEAALPCLASLFPPHPIPSSRSPFSCFPAKSEQNRRDGRKSSFDGHNLGCSNVTRWKRISLPCPQFLLCTGA